MSRALRVLVLLAVIGAGCGAAEGGSRAPAGAPQRPVRPLRLLFMGNSHSSFHELPTMVAAMVEAMTGRAVEASAAPGWMFLDERAGDPASLELLRSGSFDVVVLQAQRYSTSGKYSYSTGGAEALIRGARAAGSVPVLFPEWPRRGVDETRRIFDLHGSIAAREPACVAPVGQAWDLARAVAPGVELHADDGNHAARAGALLAALVLAGAIAGTSPEGAGYLPQFGVAFAVQAQLRSVAGRTLAAEAAFLPCK